MIMALTKSKFQDYNINGSKCHDSGAKQLKDAFCLA